MNNSLWQNKYVRGLVTLALAALVAALGSYTYLTLKQAKGAYTGETTISVSGMGEVFAKPDIGSFSFSVQSEGADATTAQTEGTTVMDAIVSYLTTQGVEEKDIKTTYYNLNPKYRYESRMCIAGSYCPPSEPIPDGFEVMQNVTIKVRNLEQAGSLISGVGDQGATNISSLSFTIDDETALKAEAREKAIADAKEKAAALAQDLGLRLDKIVGFYENEGNYPMPYYAKGGDMMAESVAAPTMNAVVPTGENTITSSVSITYQLK